MFKFKNVKVRKYLVFLAVLFILLIVFIFNLIHMNHNADYSDQTVRGNISTISSFNYSNVATVEDQVRALDNTSNASTYNGSDKLSKSQYQKIFNTSVVIGDSITEGLSDYGFLRKDQVFCKIGASIMNGDDLFGSAAGTYPKFAFFAFGMNDMGNYNGNANRFTSKYKELLRDFRKKSPDTRLFVNSISTPSESALKKNKSIKNYKKFNEALKSMCKDMHITYVDNTYILEEHKSFYAGDGIHVSPGYYNMWLNNMILKAGL
ncbi:MAG: hypothetical protein GX671_08255 [Clostridiales bacterium]|nr:hypothetical protein [Clostridiales bacterium]